MRKGDFTRLGVVVAGRLAGVLFFVLLSAILSQQAALAGSACYQHHFLGDVPNELSSDWSKEAQGLTHDADYWYIIQNVKYESCKCEGTIWRIPIGQDLTDDDVACDTPGVSCIGMSDDICDQGYTHAGDPAYYAYDGVGYLLVPLEQGDPGPAIAFFRADASLALLGWFALDTVNPAQNALAWIAVDRHGVVYVGNHNATVLLRYTVDWNRLTHGDGAIAIQFAGYVQLRDENGAPLSLESWEQGGAFSDVAWLPFPLLYIMNGDMDASCDCGINVFEFRQSQSAEECAPEPPGCLVALRVDKSTNGYGDFSYEYHPGYNRYEEPEGLTFWDLDADGRAPGISGQLHAIMLDNEVINDNVYIKHYRLETDDVPPVITCPAPATVECTGNNGIRADDPQLAPFFGGVSATDECDKAPVITNAAPAFFPLGSHEVGFTAKDYFQNASSCSASVLVQDTQDPIIAVTLDRTELWPPDHKLVTIHANVTVSDVCNPNPTFVLTSITSNEPDNGLGDGDTANDIQGAAYGTPDVEFALRAERSGKGAGRVYTVVYTAYDGSGNSSQAVATVVVPHDQGK